MVKNVDVAKRLFNDLWCVSIPELYFHSEEELRTFGVPWTGDTRMNRAMMNEPRSTYMSIAAMAIWHSEGAPITLKNFNDSLTIYELIDHHIRNWWWIMNEYPAIEAPPLEDFIKLQALIDAIKPLAEAVKSTVPERQSYLRRITTIPGMKNVLNGASKREDQANYIVSSLANSAKGQTLVDEMIRRSASGQIRHAR